MNRFIFILAQRLDHSDDRLHFTCFAASHKFMQFSLVSCRLFYGFIWLSHHSYCNSGFGSFPSDVYNCYHANCCFIPNRERVQRWIWVWGVTYMYRIQTKCILYIVIIYWVLRNVTRISKYIFIWHRASMNGWIIVSNFNSLTRFWC